MWESAEERLCENTNFCLPLCYCLSVLACSTCSAGLLLARKCIKWYAWLWFSPHQLAHIHSPAVTEHQGCYHIKVMELFLLAETSTRWGYWEHNRNGGKKITAICFLHLLWLITDCGACKQLWQEHVEGHKATGKNTHLQTHTPALSLSMFCGISTRVSERWIFLSPRSFSSKQPCLPGLAICSPCCGTQSCLWLQDFHKVATMSSGVSQKWKTRGKVSRSESGFGFDSHLGPLSCLVSHFLIFEICDFVCECVIILCDDHT